VCGKDHKQDSLCQVSKEYVLIRKFTFVESTHPRFILEISSLILFACQCILSIHAVLCSLGTE